MSSTSSENLPANNYLNLRHQYENELISSQNRCNRLSELQSTDEIFIPNDLPTGILSQTTSVFSPNSSIKSTKRKNVRFQVYDGKTFASLREMRLSMQDKLVERT